MFSLEEQGREQVISIQFKFRSTLSTVMNKKGKNKLVKPLADCPVRNNTGEIWGEQIKDISI